uniref:Protein TIC 214 n=1 Tax=Marsilea crenata TaxID=388472 RepID=S4UFY4_MARCR|nr:conserved hypothetical protein Ycf1 [Marsilea crenata]AGI51542.1 conserved hypothetical protein Ycf1 [Marsilea crenata]
MSLNILNTLSLVWVKTVGPYLLFGIYYGLLTTLPVGPSQILCIRAFMMGGNLSGLVALSGSMMAQLLLFVSIYLSPVYIFFSKPHVLTLIAIPYTLFIWFQTKDSPDYYALRPITSMRDSRIGSIFLSSFLFQLMNPILLPSPVLARLIHLFFFRYSNNAIFLISSFLGWSIGHVIFHYLVRLLVVRVEKDSPMLYVLVKRAIHTTFSIVIAINLISCLGRAPVPLFTRKYINEQFDKDLDFWQIENTELLWWVFRPWPINFFDPCRTNRPLRFIRNSRFDNSVPLKTKVSTYFFDKCVTDGKQRLSFNMLPSLSILERQLEDSTEYPNGPLVTPPSYRDWIFERLQRNEYLQKELRDRIGLLDAGSTFWNAMEKRTRLTGEEDRNRLPSIYDPFVGKSYRTSLPAPQTFLTVGELKLATRDIPKPSDDESATLASSDYTEQNIDSEWFEDWISENSRKSMHRNGTPLPWETLSKRAQRIFHFMFQDQYLREPEITEILKNLNSTSEAIPVTWEQVFSIDPLDRSLFFLYLGLEHPSFNKISLSDILSLNRGRHFYDSGSEISPIHKTEDLERDLAYNTEILLESKFDVPGMESDVRQRKLKNIGISITKTKRKTMKIAKRFAKTADFRRRLVKGSMRPRRRKMLIWENCQDKALSPFFSRLMEKRNSLQLPIDRELTDLNYGGTVTNLGEIESEQQVESKGLSGSKTPPSVIAARMDLGPIHSGRGLLLVFQSNFRKYVKLPVAIVCKNLVRMLLRQDSEWEIDRKEWRNEVHIKCSYDGEEYSRDRFPGRWLKEGLQIKILYPFRLRPWHSRGEKKRSIIRETDMGLKPIRNRRAKTKNSSKRKKLQFTYLSAWGFQTDVPFGTIQKDPSFWKPIRKKLIRFLQKNFLLRIQQFFRLDPNFNVVRIVKPTNEKSINAGKKPRVVINTDERITIDVNANSKKSSTDRTDRNEREVEAPQVDESLVDQKATDTDLLVPFKFQREIRGFEAICLELRVSFTEAVENSSRVVSMFYRGIIRGFAHYLNELFALQTRLAEVTNHAIGLREEDLSSPVSITVIPGLLRSKPLSQAYIYENLWNMGTNGNLNLSLLNSVSESDNCAKSTKDEGSVDVPYQGSPIENLIDGRIMESGEGWGLLKQLHELDMGDWNNWLDSLYRCNLPLDVWGEIAPQGWRVTFENSNILKNTERRFLEEQEQKAIQGVPYNYSVYTRNRQLRDRIRNFNKRLKYGYLIQSFIDFLRDADIQEFPMRQDAIEQKSHSENRIGGINALAASKKLPLPNAKKSESEIGLNSKRFDLMLWTIPDFLGAKTDFAKTVRPENPFFDDADKENSKYLDLVVDDSLEESFEETSNEIYGITPDERDSLDYIFRWKWKSKVLEGELERLRNLIVLIGVLGNDRDLTAFCLNMGVDLNLLCSFLDADRFDGSTKDLSVISSHRLPSVFDDQILMHKMVNPLLELSYSYRNRFKRRLYKNIYNESITRLSPAVVEEMDKQPYSYNIEDLLLPRRRREFRFLQFLFFSEAPETKEQFSDLIPGFGRTPENNQPEPNEIQRIKRFLWPSHRLEESACIGRFCFNITNVSRFSLLKIRMYPILKT